MDQQLNPRYLHYKALSGAVSLIFIVIALSVSSVASLVGGETGAGIAFLLFAFVALVVGFGLSYLVAFLDYKNYRYGITDEGFRKQYGILNLRNTMIPYEKIQNVDLRRPLLMRLFGLSSLHIQTAGGSSFATISEGSLPGLALKVAEDLQAELIARSKQARS